MEGNLRIQVIGVAVMRMIAQGTDCLSRVLMKEGVISGEHMLSFIPLHLRTLQWYQFVVEYQRQLGFYQMIHHPVMIWSIETMIKCWEQEVEIQTLMKGHSCYTTRNNYEVTLRHAVVSVFVSIQTHQPCIHKYCDFHSWWTAVYLTDQVKSDQVLKKLVTLAFCSVKI